MDHPDLIVCNFMKNSIGPKRVEIQNLPELHLMGSHLCYSSHSRLHDVVT